MLNFGANPAALPSSPPTSPLGGLSLYPQTPMPIDIDESAPELMWPLSVWTYDRMRRTDPQLGAILRALTLPLRRDIWRIDPGSASEEVANYVGAEMGLPVMGGGPATVPAREADRFQWKEHVRLALLALPMGHAGFELTYNVDAAGVHLSGGNAGVDYRPSTTMAQINVGKRGELEGITQYVPDDKGRVRPVPIPRSRLVWYTHDREGAAWAGLSILRSAYWAWKAKQRNWRAWSITNERNGMGIPNFEAPEGASKAEIKDLQDYASKLRVGEFSGGAHPYGAKLSLTGVSGTLPDIGVFLRYCDEQMARMVLASFLQLGSGPNGSRALASAQIDFFTLALEAVAGTIAETATTDIVERLVDYQFGTSTPAPKIVALPPDDAPDLEPEQLANLVRFGVVVPDKPFMAWVRTRYKMPEPDPSTAHAAIGQPIEQKAGDVPVGQLTKGSTGVAASAPSSALADALAAAVPVAGVARAAVDGVPGAARGPAVRQALTAHPADVGPLAAEVESLRRSGYETGTRQVRKAARRQVAAAAGDDEDPEADQRRRLALLVAGSPTAATAMVTTARTRAADAVDRALDDDPELSDDEVVSTAVERWAPLALMAVIAVTEAHNARRVGIADEAVVMADDVRAQQLAAIETAEGAAVVLEAQLPVGKQWVLSPEHDVVDECDDNAAAGTIGLDEDFPEGEDPHVGCRCDIEIMFEDAATGEPFARTVD